MAFPPSPKLKDSLLTNVPKDLILHKKVGTYDETDYNTKVPTGAKIYLYVFKDSTGQEYKHYLSEWDEQFMSAHRPGDHVRAIRIEKVKPDGKRVAYVQWGSPDSAEMNSPPQLQSNTAVQRQEKELDAYQDAQARKNYSIGIRGLFQSHVCAGKPNDEALKLAIEADQMIEMHVNMKFDGLSLPDARAFTPNAGEDPIF